MKFFTVFLENSGQILRSGSCGDADFDAQVSLGESIIEAKSNPDTNYVLNGEILSKPDCPDVNHIFDFDSKSWVFDNEIAKLNARNRRDLLLYQCDWTQGKDVSDIVSQKWVSYRQALRDISIQPGFPKDIIWPTPPQ